MDVDLLALFSVYHHVREYDVRVDASRSGERPEAPEKMAHFFFRHVMTDPQE